MTPPTLRVGELSFANTEPFRLSSVWKPRPCPSPRRLAQWAEEGRVDAGVLPVVEAWRLQDRFEWLAPFGIAVKKRAGSVFLFSKRPWAELGPAVIGVTDQTSTSVRLLEVLLRDREGFRVRLRSGFSESDDARLIIGDQALTAGRAGERRFPHCTDLAEQWYDWHGQPFVFARWMVRRTVPPSLKEALHESLDKALTHFSKNQEAVCRRSATPLGLTAAVMHRYFDGFLYRLGPREEASEALFFDWVMGRKKGCAFVGAVEEKGRGR